MHPLHLVMRFEQIVAPIPGASVEIVFLDMCRLIDNAMSGDVKTLGMPAIWGVKDRSVTKRHKSTGSAGRDSPGGPLMRGMYFKAPEGWMS